VVSLRWRPGIGDPTFVGWLTVAAYVIAASIAAWAFATARRAELRFSVSEPGEARDQRSMKHLWLLITVTMVLLGLNKQLDLQTLLIQTVRERAYEHGWYNDRRRYQVDFILIISAAAVFFGIGLSLRLRRVLRRVIVAVAGLGMLVVFVLIRASSFHYVDRALSLGGRFRVNALIELSGIGLIIGAALQWQVAEQRLLANRMSSTMPNSEFSVPSSTNV
jgi:amino acid transporter